jgi:hypothetical protein
VPQPKQSQWELLWQLASAAPVLTTTLLFSLLGVGIAVDRWLFNEQIKNLESLLRLKEEEIDKVKQTPATTSTQSSDTYLRPEEEIVQLDRNWGETLARPPLHRTHRIIKKYSLHAILMAEIP